MSMNGYDVRPADVQKDSQMWSSVSSELSGASSSSSSVHLDEKQLSFASRTGLAAAYVAVVQRFARLSQEGSQEASRYSEALANVSSNYSGTDADSSQRLGSSGQGLR